MRGGWEGLDAEVLLLGLFGMDWLGGCIVGVEASEVDGRGRSKEVEGVADSEKLVDFRLARGK